MQPSLRMACYAQALAQFKQLSLAAFLSSLHTSCSLW